jgi:hypothetical protein
MMSEKQRDAERRRRLAKELDKLDEHMKATEGYRLDLKILGLRNSYYEFEANYRNLTVALDSVGKIENLTTLWAVENHDKLNRLLAEITRLLHNFLARAKTLVDHTRVFKNDMYKSKCFEKVYQAKVDRDLVDSPVVSFVQDLRHYVLHKQLPITSAELSFQGGEGGTIKDYDSTIKLDVNSLREWDRWKAKSRVYLDALDDKVKIKEVAEQYEAAIRSFYQWFGEQQDQLHRAEFEELSNLETQYSQAWQEWEKREGHRAKYLIAPEKVR